MSHRAGSFSRGRNNNLGVAATVAAVSRKEPVFELSDVDSSKQVSEDEQVPGRQIEANNRLRESNVADRNTLNRT